jgi:hypothetical protein
MINQPTETERKVYYCSFTGTEVVGYTALAFILGCTFMLVVIREAAEYTAEKTIRKILENRMNEQKEARPAVESSGFDFSGAVKTALQRDSQDGRADTFRRSGWQGNSANSGFKTYETEIRTPDGIKRLVIQGEPRIF